jgi:hypothetical protein
MQTCPACQHDVQEEAHECPHCGVVFAKWKGRNPQATVPVVQSNATDEQAEKDQPDLYPLPLLNLSEREDLIRLVSFDYDERPAVHTFNAALRVNGIVTEIREKDEVHTLSWSTQYFVYVARMHLFPSKVVQNLRAEHMTWDKLAKQPLMFRQKFLVDAMLDMAGHAWCFKSSLFPQQALAWYQANAQLTDQQMQSAIVSAPRTHRATTRSRIIGSALLGAICAGIGLLPLRGESANEFLPWIFLAGAGLLIYCLKKIVELVRSEKEWQP